MDDVSVINRVLVKLFRRINAIEERAICTGKFKNLTINELHVIEAIGAEGSNNMTAVAKSLDVTTGSLTISVISLVRKGLATRVRSEEDRRVVLVKLTELGKEANARHEEFHSKMIDAIASELDSNELEALTGALYKLNDYFESYDV